MPEGDTVYRLAARLRAALAGQQLSATRFRVPQLATTDLSGYRVEEVVPRGKHLLMRLAPPQGDEGRRLTLHSHLMMDGHWELQRPGERWKGPAHAVRVVLETTTCSAVGFEIHQLKLAPTEHEDELVGHLGPDLLGPDWDPVLAEANLRSQPARPLGTALLDQRMLAGIGNIYRAEILFLTRLHPQTPCGAVPRMDRVVQVSHRLLQVNKDRARRVTTGTERTREPLWVYGRTGKPCLRCGAKVRMMGLGDEFGSHERDCYYCPACQELEE